MRIVLRAHERELVNSCLVPVLQAEGAEFRRLKGWPTTEHCTVCSRRFSIAAAHNAASAHQVC